MAKLFPLKRMTLILNRLRDGRSASPKELAEYVASRAGILDDRMGTVSRRTIQRDIRTIGELFRIDIECNSSREYQQRWYLIGYDSDGILKTFGPDRMHSVSVAADEKFVRDDAVDVPSLFRESFGIWNNPSDPAEEIVLKYDALDGAFVKTLPLHSSQEILSDTSDGITVRLRLRITNKNC